MIGFIIQIALCFLAGYLGTKLMRGRPDGLLSNILLGFVGGIVGDWICRLLQFHTHGMIWEIITSTAGACLVIWLVRKFDLMRFFRNCPIA